MKDSPFIAPEIHATHAADSMHPLDYSGALLSAPALNRMEIVSRPLLLGQWMREADIGFIFAARGVGKTWMANLICNALAEGRCLGEWKAGESPRNVLYVDGEMTLADTQSRMRMIGVTAPNFKLLHHEQLSSVSEETLNIAEKSCQAAIGALLNPGDVLVLDNLSALCRGVEENSNDEWELLLVWLLALRRRKITTILIHHAGRNREMRGASRREDAADWVLRLTDDTEDDGTSVKAIVSSFTKCRGCAPDKAMPLRWTLEFSEEGLRLTCKERSGPDALEALILSGVSSASDCAELLHVSTGAISKWAGKLTKQGRIQKKGREYLPPDGSNAAA